MSYKYWRGLMFFGTAVLASGFVEDSWLIILIGAGMIGVGSAFWDEPKGD